MSLGWIQKTRACLESLCQHWGWVVRSLPMGHRGLLGAIRTHPRKGVLKSWHPPLHPQPSCYPSFTLKWPDPSLDLVPAALHLCSQGLNPPRRPWKHPGCLHRNGRVARKGSYQLPYQSKYATGDGPLGTSTSCLRILGINPSISPLIGVEWKLFRSQSRNIVYKEETGAY